ncbi:MAG: hypothetical protein CME88_04065 [Hirschia sp.]|nr:hypothetical protein [Hirschia sp.]MBF17534.1 hypothetical protein [Hirschia sp.]|tara:strand:+ start:124 stop:483 length:360 start_codon:yes stop_codon:yes gene_type:complete
MRWIGGTLFGIIAIAFAGYAFLFWENHRTEPFDQTVWLANVGIRDGQKQSLEPMARGLITSRALIGLSRDEIIDLLGPSEYKLGNYAIRAYAHPGDTVWLVVDYYEPEDRVTGARILVY